MPSLTTFSTCFWWRLAVFACESLSDSDLADVCELGPLSAGTITPAKTRRTARPGKDAVLSGVTSSSVRVVRDASVSAIAKTCCWVSASVASVPAAAQRAA